MKALALHNRQEISILLVFSMLFSCWLVMPMPAKAGFLGTVGKIAKTVVVTAGSLAAAYGGGVLGIALGGGPIGMVAGAVGGYIVGKKVLGWATSSVANFSTVAGAIGGGVLAVTMGAPILGIAAAVVGGAMIARTVVKLFKKVTGKTAPMVQVPTTAEMDKKCKDFINGMKQKELEGSSAAIAAPVQSVQQAPASKNNMQDSYNKYLAAYKAYMEATSKGDTAAAKKAFTDYQKNLAAYQSSYASGS